MSSPKPNADEAPSAIVAGENNHRHKSRSEQRRDLLNGDSSDSEADDLGGPSSRPTFLNDTILSAQYTASDVRKRPRNCVIGFCSVLIVCFFIGIILIGISKTNVVFLRFAELSIGEMDALLLAEGDLPFLNYSDFEPKIRENASRTFGTAPRWLAKGELQQIPRGGTTTAATPSSSTSNATTAAPPPPPLNLTTTASPPLQFDIPVEERSIAANVILIDSELEPQIGIGRAWPYREIGYAEAQVFHSALRFIGVRPNAGKRARLFLDIGGILDQQNVDLFGATAVDSTVPPIDLVATNFTAAEANVTIGNATVTIPALDVISLANLVSGSGFAGNLTPGGQALLDAINSTNGFGLLNAATLQTLLQPELKLTIADAIQAPAGKYPATLGNMAILDYRQLVDMLLEQLCYSTLRSPLSTIVGPASPTIAALPEAETIKQLANLREYVLVTVAMMKDRFNIYYKETNARNKELIRFSNDLFYAIGVDFEGSAQYPIALALVAFDFFSLFLTSIFSSVVAVIVVLGALLIYTLLLTNAEERSFEVAMLRAQGMSKRQLVTLMLFQSSVFLLPGILACTAILLLGNVALESVLTLFTHAPADYGRIDIPGMVVPVCVALFITALANWRPIQSVIRASLRDALDVYRNTSTETTVTVIKLAELGLEPWQLLLGWLLTIAGFVTYYVVPFSFIFGQLWLFFLIMNFILLGMLMGLCLITYSIRHWLEHGFLFLLLWGPDRCLKTLIQRNLQAHSERNSKAFMMFTMSVAAVVFGGVLFTMLSESIAQTVEVINGADVTMQSLLFDFPLNRSNLEPFLRSQSKYVAAFSFATFDLGSYPQVTQRSRIASIIGFPRRGQNIQGVDENLLDAVYKDYVLVDELEDDVPYPQSAQGQPDFIRSMYETTPVSTLEAVSRLYTGFPPNETQPAIEAKYNLVVPMVVSSAAESVIGVSAGTVATLTWGYAIGQGEGRQTETTIFLSKARALCRKMSAFPSMTSLTFGFSASYALIPTNFFQTFLRANEIDFPEASKASVQYRYDANADTEIRYQRLFVRLQPGISDTDRQDLVNLLQAQANPYYHLTIDTVDVVETVRVAADLVIYFFYFASAVAIILDTFMLWLAFVSNVQLNAWSFAVLRSLGFRVTQLIRAFIYESLCLVLGGFFMGTIIGILIAMTLVLQLNLFLQLPFQFSFPIPLFFLLLGLSLLSSVIASWVPARKISQRSISSVLKSG